MSAESLARQCVEVMNFHTQHQLPMEQARITTVTPKCWKPPPRFPRGELLQVKENGDRVWSLPAMRVLAWLVANNFVKMDPGAPVK